MHIVKYRYFYFILPIVLVLASLVCMFVFGFKPGVDLRGGALLEIVYTNERPEVEEAEERVHELDLGEIRIQPTGEKGFLVRSRQLTLDEKQLLITKLAGNEAVVEERFTSIGSTIGDELRTKGGVALVCVALSVVLYITFVFRHTSKPVASWKYGFVAIITLLHDIIIPAGLFVILGVTQGAEVDALFIVAILTILGISINDTIVVFDRIRENLKKNEDKKTPEAFENVVGRSMDETTSRSLNTSLTVVCALVILFVFGPETTHNLALVLMVGMIAGTYSSLFLAAPLLVDIEKMQGESNPVPK